MLIRSGLGLSFGIVFSVLLFKRRAWPAYVGLGFGAGRAWEECDSVSLHLLQKPNDPRHFFFKGIEFTC
jgi:MICOS complex subunit MIC10